MSQRATLEDAARQGNPVAIAKLSEEGPECPRALRYLLEILYAVHARSGIGMNGYAPLSYGTLADYSRLTRTELDPEDVEALFVLDAVMLNPAEPKRAR